MSGDLSIVIPMAVIICSDGAPEGKPGSGARLACVALLNICARQILKSRGPRCGASCHIALILIASCWFEPSFARSQVREHERLQGFLAAYTGGFGNQSKVAIGASKKRRWVTQRVRFYGSYKTIAGPADVF